MTSGYSIDLPSDGSTLLLGIVQNEDVKKVSNVVIMEQYGQDSGSAYAQDLGGVSRVISISGRITSTQAALADILTDHQAFLAKFESLMQGKQDTTNGYPAKYYSALLLDKNYARNDPIYVKFLELSYNWQEGAPNQLNYTLKMVEANQAI